jgi:hypothetical protein
MVFTMVGTQGKRCFSVGSVQRGYLENNRHYESVSQSDSQTVSRLSVGNSHGNFVVE